MIRPDDLSPLDRATRALRRLSGFGLLVVLSPSRRAAQGAKKQSETLVRDAGLPLVVLDSHTPRAATVVEIIEASAEDRRRRFEDLNLRRDRLASLERRVVLVLLEADLPLFSKTAPDLWSVRTEVFRHDALVSPAALPEPLPLPEDGALPPQLDAATRFISLTGLHAGEDGRRVPQATLDSLYLELSASAPPPRSDTQRGMPLVGPALPLLTRFQTALLEAEAGGGKSTLLRALARGLSRAGREVVLVSLRGLRPEDLALDDLSAGLEALCARCPWRPAADERPWVLLDGLDELPGVADRARIALFADDLVYMKLAAGAVVSTRPSGLPGLLAPEGHQPDAESATSWAALADLPRVRLSPLTDGEIETYLQRWTEATLDEAERARHLGALRATIGLTGARGDRTRRLRSLCGRPLFLAVVAALVWSRGAELDGEVEVLDAFVQVLIHRRREGVGRGLGPQDLRALAGELAWVLYQAQAYAAPSSVVQRASSILTFGNLDALRVGTGLLMDDDTSVSFVHAALQEVLAAHETFDRVGIGDQLAGHLWPNGQILMSRSGAVPRLLAELLLRQMPNAFTEFLGARCRASRLFVFGVADLLATVVGRQPPLRLSGLYSQVKSALHALNRGSPSGSWWHGTVTADLLAQLGDDRLGALDFVAVTDDWALARWPVTVRQYRDFVGDGGYGAARWWTKEGWQWRSRPARSRSKGAPERWQTPPFDHDNQPVCGLSHHEAQAYVRWCRERRDPSVDLPPRSVWEAAARRSPEWRSSGPRSPYSWAPRPVGAQIWSASEQGVEDLGGLVRQWLRPEGGQDEISAGYAFSDEPVSLEGSFRTGTGRGGRRWYHPYGLRLARRLS